MMICFRCAAVWAIQGFYPSLDAASSRLHSDIPEEEEEEEEGNWVATIKGIDLTEQSRYEVAKKERIRS